LAWWAPSVSEYYVLGFGGVGIEVDKALGKVYANALTTGIDKPTHDLKELSGGGEADIQSLAVTFRIGSMRTISNSTDGFVVLGATATTGDVQGKATVIPG
jgi:hypothetical protein